MTTENERGEALAALSVALVRVMQLGLAVLPPAEMDALARRVNDEGSRIRFTILLAPLQLVCQETMPDPEEAPVLFTIETGSLPAGAPH